MAPNNVYIDEYGYETIIRQPSTSYELQQVIKAAVYDPFQGYSMDGDTHWTRESVTAWWTRVGELKDNLSKKIKLEMDSANRDFEALAVVERWLLFLEEEARSEIRQYRRRILCEREKANAKNDAGAGPAYEPDKVQIDPWPPVYTSNGMDGCRGGRLQ